MAEFRGEGRGDLADHTMIGRELREFGRCWVTPEGFAEYVGWLRAQALEDSLRPEGYVPSTTLWWFQDDDYLGRLAIRHRLTAQLLDFGGHIGYDVRPSARRRGHATAMLRAALPVAHGLGIASALVMCDVTNIASRKVIETTAGSSRINAARSCGFGCPQLELELRRDTGASASAADSALRRVTGYGSGDRCVSGRCSCER